MTASKVRITLTKMTQIVASQAESQAWKAAKTLVGQQVIQTEEMYDNSTDIPLQFTAYC